MDEKDRKILKLLQGNARRTYQEIGDELGMSRVAAKKRIRKLEEDGVIRGYNTCIYEEGEIRAFILVETIPERFDAMLRYVSTRMQWVRQIFCLYRQNHFLMVVSTPSSEDLRYMANVIAKQEGVVKVTCDAVSEVIKDVYGGVRRYEENWEPQRGDEYEAAGLGAGSGSDS